jgi:hypothetical protein
MVTVMLQLVLYGHSLRQAVMTAVVMVAVAEVGWADYVQPDYAL